jgi:hypothetical protein
MSPIHLPAGARFTPVTIVLMVVCLLTVWPLAIVPLVHALWGERLGWRSRVDAFLLGLRRGLCSGASCCGPSMFFSHGRCTLDRSGDDAGDRGREH